MNQVTIDLEALIHNLETTSRWVHEHGASLTLVTKALCGHRPTLHALQCLGVRSIADSRLDNFEALDREHFDLETWYLRPPPRSVIRDVVAAADVSLNSELEVIRELGHEAARQGTTHQVVIMIELGDLREGILPGELVAVYEEIFKLPNIKVLGIGGNLGCLSGAVPTIDELMQLVLYRELLELKFNRRLPLISAGTSAVLPMMREGRLPPAINHFRIGESILLGTNPITGEVLEGLRADVVTLEAEIVEIQEKRLVPSGEVTDMAPFGEVGQTEDLEPGQRGYRAVVTIGQVDTEIGSLTPLDPDHSIAGASSDLTVVNVGNDPRGLEVGDTIAFRTSYSAFVRLMSNQYTDHILKPGPQELTALLEREGARCPLPPVARGHVPVQVRAEEVAAPGPSQAAPM